MTLDPLNWDEIGDKHNGGPNGIPDGLDMDNDFDGLPDGYEFMGMNTTEYNFTSTFRSPATKGSGGPFNPDSDYDSLPDGLEVWILGTSPTSNDTDLDGFSDGLEERIHTDPLVPTSWAEFSHAMNIFSYVHVATPISISYNGKIVPVRVDAPSNTEQVTFKLYHEQSNSWSKEIKLQYDSSQDSWIIPQEYLLLDTGNYFFRAYMYLDDGDILTESVSFAIQVPLKIFDFENISEGTGTGSQFQLVLFSGLFGTGLLGSLAIMNVGRLRKKVPNILKKRKEDIPE